jgi:hypothetical protein
MAIEHGARSLPVLLGGAQRHFVHALEVTPVFRFSFGLWPSAIFLDFEVAPSGKKWTEMDQGGPSLTADFFRATG